MASPAGKGWRAAPPPAWVVRHDVAIGPPGSPGAQPARDGWHALLVDQQRMIDPDDGKSGHYLMLRTLVTDASGLGSAGRFQISFDPAYEKVQLHAFALWRDGRRLDRLANARIELLRREAGLEREALDGRETLLVLLQDVRVGDIVEASYSVLGHNPVHGGAHDGVLDVAFDMPVDRLFSSVTSRSTRRLHVTGVRAGDLSPVRDEGGVQRWEQESSGIAGVQAEDETPSDYAVYPHVAYTDDADWHEVSDWGVKLFAVDPALGGELEHRLDAWRTQGLQGAALASTALSLVQDEVRYFSASLGENSHRPKAPARTWADRAGDCKDKAALLVAILQRLGFDAKPALVSTTARASLADWPPGHGAFDHAIVRLRLDGRTWWLDGTRTDQSTRLETRAAPPIAWALVVAPETRALEAVQAPPPAGPAVTYDHAWDTSDLSKPARVALTVDVRDDAAEGYRAAIAAGHLQELVDSVTARYRSRFPDYKRLGEPVVRDDRAENRLSVQIEGEVAQLGEVHDALMSIELYPLRVFDALVTPSQVQRAMPWAYDPPRTLVERIRVVLPQPHHLEAPLRRDIADAHFALALSGTGIGRERVYEWRFERRGDVVTPADLARFRDRISKARSDHDFSLQAPLYDNDLYQARIREVKPQLDKDPHFLGNDELAEQIGQAYGQRVADDLVLAGSRRTSRVGRLVLLDRVTQDLLLGEDETARTDLDGLPAEALEGPEAQYTRGLVLMSSGRFAEAEKAFRAGVDAPHPAAGPARRWIGIAAYYDGRLADAVRSLREAVEDETGDERSISLAWLFLSAQRLDRRGEDAIAAFLPHAQDTSGEISTSRIVGVLRTLSGMSAKGTTIPADFKDLPALRDFVAGAQKEPRTARQNLARAVYFIAQLADAMGEHAGADELLRLLVNMHATALPEDLCARIELRRADRKAPVALLDQARQAAASGDHRGAAVVLRRALAEAPNDVDALLALGRVELEQEHCTAFDGIRRAAALRANDPAVGVLLARARAFCGDMATGARELDRWIADASTSDIPRAEALAWRSMMLGASSDDALLRRSEADAQAAMRLAPDLPLSREATFWVHINQEHFQDALFDADQMERIGAPTQIAEMYRGMALRHLERDDEAEAALTRAIALEPGQLRALAERSRTRQHRGDLDGAQHDAREVVAASPDCAACWERLKDVQQERGDPAAAREALDQQIRLDPKDAGLRFERGEIDVDLGEPETAVADYDRAIEIKPTGPRYWINRAHQLLRAGREGDAVPSCQKGLAIYPSSLNRSSCAVLAWKAGDHARAIEAIESLQSKREEMLAGGEAYWFGSMGEALLGYGRGNASADFLHAHLEKHPNWAYGAVFLYFARARAGDEPAARAELAARIFEIAPKAWPSHVVDHALHRIGDDELRQASQVDAPGDFAGQACEATFYIGMRHWVDGDFAGAQAQIAQAASQCPRDFAESFIARAWLAAGPGAAAVARK